jgi:hypothetical protein
MSNGNAALTLALGAGAGLGLWYLLREHDEKEETGPAAGDPAQGAQATPPCALRLDAKGLTLDGAPIDIPTAVSKCQAAGRADLVLADDAPSAIAADLGAAFNAAGILIGLRRNARARRPKRPRRQAAPRTELGAFAATVRALADQIDEAPTAEGLARGRFGRKVFIAAIRRALRSTEYASLSRAAVDRLLVDANREGLLELARADLPAVMDPAEVRDSEIQHLMSTWHFVVAPLGERSRDLRTQRARDDRHAPAYDHFTLRIYPEGTKGGAQLRYFDADPATSWKDAYYRLIAAGIVDARRAGRTREPGGWMLSVDPADYRADRAEALP